LAFTLIASEKMATKLAYLATGFRPEISCPAKTTTTTTTNKEKDTVDQNLYLLYMGITLKCFGQNGPPSVDTYNKKFNFLIIS
jgi:hypothetical protein